jgi:hypothetical protein
MAVLRASAHFIPLTADTDTPRLMRTVSWGNSSKEMTNSLLTGEHDEANTRRRFVGHDDR